MNLRKPGQKHLGPRGRLDRRRDRPSAFRDAADTGPRDSPVQIRGAGVEAMRGRFRQPWTSVDEGLDESFPASDPPATHRFD